MNKIIPKTIAGKIWVIFLAGNSIVQVYLMYGRWGESLGIAFLIDAVIRVVLSYAIFYALPLGIYQRQRDYFRNKRNNHFQEEE